MVNVMPQPFAMELPRVKTLQPAILFAGCLYVDAAEHVIQTPGLQVDRWIRTPVDVVSGWMVEALASRTITLQGYLLATITLQGYLDVTLPMVSARVVGPPSPSARVVTTPPAPRVASFARRFPHLIKSRDPLTFYTPEDGKIYWDLIQYGRSARSARSARAK
jgi:hypothetical protein